MTEHLDGTLFGEGQPCFGCGPDHPIGFRLCFERDGETLVTRFTPEARYQGPPGIMHGGLVTTLADEVAAWAIIGLLGKFGFTAKIDVKLARAVRIGVELEGRSWVVKETPRIVDVGVRITQEGVECLSGELRFVIVDRKGAERLLGEHLPEAWNRFTR
jgi:acyl-coenzyme A thioesterase PaaI-like protein